MRHFSAIISACLIDFSLYVKVSPRLPSLHLKKMFKWRSEEATIRFLEFKQLIDKKCLQKQVYIISDIIIIMTYITCSQ